ncbi:YdcF family protein [Halotia wernerae UHCC 0503]|nr:YdcF family protein [Halotia wernerae UHCC 0503]
MFFLAGFILSLLLIIPVRLEIAIYHSPQPQAFLILGGEPAREKFTAEIAQWYPSLEIWVSSPPDTQKTSETFQAENIPDTQVHIDLRAVDTVTNFTSLVADFKQRQLQHLYLVTSDYHMARAKAIAVIVLGSQGIAFTPLSVPSNDPQESTIRIIRDVVRSLLWLFTGRTGASFHTVAD